MSRSSRRRSTSAAGNVGRSRTSASEVERLRQPVGRARRRRPRRRPSRPRRGARRRAARDASIRRDRVVALGALGQGPGREDRRPGLRRPARRPRRSAARATPRRAAGRAGRRRGCAGRWRRRCSATVGNSYGPRRAGAGPLGDDGAVASGLADRCVALMPPPRRSRPSVPSASSASSSAAGPSGRYVRTSRLSGRNTSAADGPDRLRGDRQVARQHPVDEVRDRRTASRTSTAGRPAPRRAGGPRARRPRSAPGPGPARRR